MCAATSTLPWVEKYRPAALSDILSHQDIIATLRRFIDSNKLPHLLFYGPAGTGKTTTVLAIARSIPNCETLELNASDERGIDVVREQIKDFASTQKLFSSGYKLVILDEADHMTSDAQAALRRVIEKYTKNVRFCLICNYVNKIIPALQSRCTKFRFGPLTGSTMNVRLREIAQAEGVSTKVTDDAIDTVISLCEGDMRKCVNLLQAVVLSSAGEGGVVTQTIDAEAVYVCAGAPRPTDIQAIVEAGLKEHLREAYASIQIVKTEGGLALVDIVRRVSDLLMQLELSQTASAFALKQLADIEYRLSNGTSEQMQLGALVGCLQLLRMGISETAI